MTPVLSQSAVTNCKLHALPSPAAAAAAEAPADAAAAAADEAIDGLPPAARVRHVVCGNTS